MCNSKNISVMMSDEKQLKLIIIYMYVCQIYEKELWCHCQRFSNNYRPALTDQEVMAIYLFAIHCQGIFQVKQIHGFARDYLMSWFPALGSYQAFAKRLNRFSGAFGILAGRILSENRPADCSEGIGLMDSMPIVTCKGSRAGKVARELTDKGYCSSKKMWYFGLKLHALGSLRRGRLPHPDEIEFTPASVNDLSLFKQSWFALRYRAFFGDKIYLDGTMSEEMARATGSEVLTPVKAVKGACDALGNFDRAADELYSKAVSSVRQPIESLFNWLIEKADIQNASKVRSTAGLLTHAFGRLAAAFIILIF